MRTLSHLAFGPFRQYFQTSGRSTRIEYWAFLLMWITGFYLTVFADYLLFGQKTPYLIISFVALTIIPGSTLAIRRLHDSGKSGLWLFFLWLGGIGMAILLVAMAARSEDIENEYGPVPGTEPVVDHDIFV